jgi:hypothetical protein
MSLPNLPAPVSAYIAATNHADIEVLMAFAEDALVNAIATGSPAGT